MSAVVKFIRRISTALLLLCFEVGLPVAGAILLACGSNLNGETSLFGHALQKSTLLFGLGAASSSLTAPSSFERGSSCATCDAVRPNSSSVPPSASPFPFA